MPSQKAPSEDTLHAALPALFARYGRRSSVTGCDVGYKWTDRAQTKDLCLRIHVDRKIPITELATVDVFPAEFEGLPLDVIAGDYRPSDTLHGSASPRTRFPVLTGGISCGRPGDGTGTLGLIVIDKRTGNPCALSNWHVFAGPSGQAGDPILQPGTLDGGDWRQDVVAHLGVSVLGGNGDAAIAPLTKTRPWLPGVLHGMRDLVGARDPELGEILNKTGRTTGGTEALVEGIGIYKVPYEIRPGRWDTIEIRGFKLMPIEPGNATDVEVSMSGDSGSAWISEKTNHAVGLHFAGETHPDPTAEFALACHMTNVCQHLGVRIARLDDIMAAEEARQKANRRLDEPIPESLGAYGLPSAALNAPYPNWPLPNWPFPMDPRWPSPLRSGLEYYYEKTMPQHPGRTFVPSASLVAGTELKKRVSRNDEIWPNLIAALKASGVNRTELIDPFSKTKNFLFIPPGDQVAQALRNWSFFDPIATRGRNFDHASIFSHILIQLTEEFEAAGYEVTL